LKLGKDAELPHESPDSIRFHAESTRPGFDLDIDESKERTLSFSNKLDRFVVIGRFSVSNKNPGIRER
jgi:hypothetical protein